MTQENPHKIIETYEEHRRRFTELEKTLEELDRKLASLEPQLPDGYLFPGDVE